MVRFLVFVLALAIAMDLTSSVPMHRRMTSGQSLSKATCRYSSSDWQAEFNVTLDWKHFDEISLKRQLRAIIIEIQKMIAEIEKIKFRNRSLWDCRVYKNPLKEIVIDIEVDSAEIEKLIVEDKKQRRDWHKPVLSSGETYEKDSLENQNASNKKDAARNINLVSVKPFQDSLECNCKIEQDSLNSNDHARKRNINDRVVLNGKTRKNITHDAFRAKFKNSLEDLDKIRNNNRYMCLSLKSFKKAKQIYFTPDANLNINTFNYKLNDNHVNRKKNIFGNNIKLKSESLSSEELMALPDKFRLINLNQEGEKRNKNCNINANLNAVGNKRGNLGKFVQKVSKTNINPHVNMNLLTENSDCIPAFDSKSKKISLDNSAETYQMDSDEKNHHNPIYFHSNIKDEETSSSKDDEISTKDRTNWQTNSYLLMPKKNTKSGLQCQHTSATTNININIKKKDDNGILSFDESNEDFLKSDEMVIANDNVKQKDNNEFLLSNNSNDDILKEINSDEIENISVKQKDNIKSLLSNEFNEDIFKSDEILISNKESSKLNDDFEEANKNRTVSSDIKQRYDRFLSSDEFAENIFKSDETLSLNEDNLKLNNLEEANKKRVISNNIKQSYNNEFVISDESKEDKSDDTLPSSKDSLKRNDNLKETNRSSIISIILNDPRWSAIKERVKTLTAKNKINRRYNDGVLSTNESKKDVFKSDEILTSNKDNLKRDDNFEQKSDTVSKLSTDPSFIAVKEHQRKKIARHASKSRRHGKMNPKWIEN